MSNLADPPAEREPSRRRLLVFSKIPAPGGSKTRLVPPLSRQEASDLARAFLLDALASVTVLPGIDTWLYLTIFSGDGRLIEESMPELYRSPLKECVTVRMQSGADLGERLSAAFDDAFADGCNAVCAVGSDHPTLPVRLVDEAFEALCSRDMVIGPADDGGYYLIAMREHRPELLLDLPYSTSALFDRVTGLAAEQGVSSHVLERWYDVDDAASLARLRTERESLPASGHTAAMLALLDERTDEESIVARENR